MLTAEEARTHTIDQCFRQSEQELKRIEELINDAIKLGKFSIELSVEPCHRVISCLELLGYTLKYGIDGSKCNFIISWKKKE